MFFPEGQVRIFVYGEPVSMRLSYDGLYAKIRNVMGKDPLSVSDKYAPYGSASYSSFFRS